MPRAEGTLERLCRGMRQRPLLADCGLRRCQKTSRAVVGCVPGTPLDAYRPSSVHPQKPTPNPKTARPPHQSPQENPDRLRQPTGFQPISPPPKAAAPHPRPSNTPDPQDRAPASLPARIPSQKRYGAPQYSATSCAFQYLPGIKKRNQKYWTLHFPAAYKSVP